MNRPLCTALIAAWTMGCGDATPTPFVLRGDAGAADDVALDAAAVDAPLVSADVTPRDAALPPVTDDVLVYAHTSSELYAVDPRALTLRRVGAFAFPNDGRDHQMTDLAIDSRQQFWGITFDSIYRVNPTDARCVFVAPFLGSMFNALSFIPGGELDPEAEVLVGADRGGAYYRVDTRTGAVTRLGAYGAGLGSSGDIVSVAGGGTFATVTDGDEELLARIDPRTGAATRIGPTGLTHTWGVGYWRSRVFGFTEGGTIAVIDIARGSSMAIPAERRAWWGAAVTTTAPVAPP